MAWRGITGLNSFIIMDLEAQMREGIDANKCMESQLMDPVMEVIMGQV